MRSIFVLYLPGHAGHMISRLFGLSPEAMPLVERKLLKTVDITSVDKLHTYQFTNVKSKFQTWQDFHREYSDHKDSNTVRIINAVSGHYYSCVIYPIHPYEFHYDFQEIDQTQCYYVELDLLQWGTWVEQQRKILRFINRYQEQQYFDQYKISHCMEPISLTKMLTGEQEFREEYLRVANSMNITPVLDQAIELFNDWKTVRVPT